MVVEWQIMGFGWAGIFRRYLVEPAAMWWPANLVQVSFIRFSLWFFSNHHDTRSSNRTARAHLHVKFSNFKINVYSPQFLTYMFM